MTRIQANLFLLLSGAIWGAGFVAQSTAMEAIGPLWFIGLRFAIAMLVALPLVLIEARRTERPLSRGSMRNFTFIGLALFGGAVTQQFGLLTTTVTNSGFLTGLYVVFVPILTVVFLRRRPHWIIWPAALMASLGIFLLSGGSLSGLTGGDLLTIVCALFWAIQVMLIGIFAASTGRPMLLSMTQFAVCAVLGILLAALFEPLSVEAVTGALPEILYAGVFSSGIAFICQVVGQRHTTAPQAAIFLSSEALFAAFFGMMLLGEVITPVGYVGCAVIFAAMLLVELVPELTNRRREAAV
ncbi:Permease of the drug/metabolite transporter (DMT) superfamily [Sinorhizobium sojae CCBAU 05684]|uniref:Permease of the drug/metabolite transporter (DMT) superfamily n=1 Tax=Sinorhizobium sojae CCBAU 05684 TaxID=716928 RepID=A0A249PD16_9HYPH|nr:DMT family transporter [Sinorhizobium sojae]ASY63808.1 Permease of the drug/metabolite transporter (DMT) superfamily [Sinorhizobium sojae CCBAU 05684]